MQGGIYIFLREMSDFDLIFSINTRKRKYDTSINKYKIIQTDKFKTTVYILINL